MQKHPVELYVANTIFFLHYFYKQFVQMKRHDRQEDGMYHIHGHKYEQLEGTRAQVWHGTAYKTPGGLVKSDLKMNKWGHIVSAKKSVTAKKEKRLEKAGWTAKKGKFGPVRVSQKTRKHRK
jgi:DVNP family